MAKKAYDERKVIASLSRRGVMFDYSTHLITVNKEGANVVGIHSLGKLDYLEHYCGWRTRFVSNSTAVSVYNENKKNNKEAKQEKKLNMASMVKKQIKRVK